MKCVLADRDRRCFVDIGGKYVELIAAMLVEEGDGGSIFNLPTDDVTGALIIAELEHVKVHEGEMFSVSHRFTGIANNGTADLRVTVGASEPAHVKWNISSGGKIYIDIYEETTFTNLGTAVTPQNMNRLSSNTPDTTFGHTPTVNAIGTSRYESVSGSNSNPVVRAGESIRQHVEWVLAPTKNYLLRVTNKSGSLQDIGVAIEFYEDD